MKLFQRTFNVFAATALAASLAACGGGDDSSTPTSTLKLSGVAATGRAISNGTVSVQCKSGSGSTTTNANGSYAATVSNGTGPCLVTVTGSSNGSTVNLRSIALPDASGSATANVNQLSDAVVVALAAAKGASTPTALVTSATAIPSQNDISAATTATITAVNAAIQTYNTANGTKLPTLSTTANLLSDPNFVAATSTTSGSAVDQTLDALKTANLVSVSNGTLTQTVQTNITTTTTQTVKPNATGSAG